MKKDNEREHAELILTETYPCDRCGQKYPEAGLYQDSETDAVYCQKCFEFLEAQGQIEHQRQKEEEYENNNI